MINLTKKKCGDCGYDYVRDSEPHEVLSMGQEIVYLASRGIDEPWLCPSHRQHK